MPYAVVVTPKNLVFWSNFGGSVDVPCIVAMFIPKKVLDLMRSFEQNGEVYQSPRGGEK